MSHDANHPRDVRVLHVVEDVVRRRHAGENVVADQVIREHPDLMPDLDEALSLANVIEVAVKEAKSTALLPGKLLLDRFRIVRIVGNGGMGEVYQAEDLKLGQTVALKFLPPRLDQDVQALHMLHAEVRIARSIAHPNVCRVYDIHEFDGRHFLTMEFIDGEDLGCMLQRGGSVPPDRAIEIARQLCVGLAEAHRLGVIHRDLKPSNVMVDSHGIVRITDFGLAMDDRGQHASPTHAGTPEYMSPEQVRGEEATVQSDLFALGLILYEIFAGKHFFEQESALLKVQLDPMEFRADPSMLKNLPTAIREVIRKCVIGDPGARPLSANEVLAELPMADLRVADVRQALPTPELVAVSAGGRQFSFKSALALFILIVMSLVAGAVRSRDYRLFENANLSRTPAQLQQTVQNLLTELGHGLKSGAHTAAGFQYSNFERALHPATADRAIQYWYRQSELALVRKSHIISRGISTARVSSQAPPLITEGDVLLELGTDGLLYSYFSVPSDDTLLNASEAISILFAKAGLRQQDFEPRDQKGVPSGRTVWVNRQDGSTQVVVNQRQGQLVEFRVAERVKAAPSTLKRHLADGMDEALLATLLICGAFIARRNLLKGRGDRRGAKRLATFACVTTLVSWVFMASHVPSIAQEVRMARMGIANAFFWSAALWVVYLALEPMVRSQWPNRLVSWNRVLRGRWRDPLVGRDLLIGTLAGAASVPILCSVDIVVRNMFDLPPRFAIPSDELYPLAGMWLLVPVFSHAACNAVYHGFAMMLMPLLLRQVVRSTAVAIALSLGIITTFLYFEFGDGTPWFAVYMFLWAIVFQGTTLCFGLLPGAAMFFTFQIILLVPVTANTSEWYWPISLMGMICLVAVAVIGLAAAWPQPFKQPAKSYLPPADGERGLAPSNPRRKASREMGLAPKQRD